MSVGGRVVCLQCGANNFDTQAACWKCGASLASVSAGPPPPASVRPNGSVVGGVGGTRPSAPSPLAVAPASAFQSSTVDPSVALWSAIALGVLFPFFAIPVGIVFLMLDDRRKAELGRITLVWGILGTIFHTLVTAWMIKGAVDQVRAYVPFLNRGGASGGAITLPNQSQPSLTAPAPRDAVRDLNFPSP